MPTSEAIAYWIGCINAIKRLFYGIPLTGLNHGLTFISLMVSLSPQKCLEHCRNMHSLIFLLEYLLQLEIGRPVDSRCE